MRLSIGQMSESVRFYRVQQPGELMGHEFLSAADRDADFWMDRIAMGQVPELIHTNALMGEARSYVDANHEAGSRLIADVDDLFDDVPPGNDAAAHAHGYRLGLYQSLLEEAEGVTCSTPFLADRFGGKVAPNFIDPNSFGWPARKSKKDDECVILVPSANGRAEDYLHISKAMEEVIKLPHVKVVLMNFLQEWALPIGPPKVVFCRWVPFGEYPRMLAHMAPDVIISPMIHHDFNLAKSNIKWLESGAVGACFMGERWGEYQRTVQDGVTGILAEGVKEWTSRLRDICIDVDLRRKVAKAGQAQVRNSWTWPAVEQQWRAAMM